MSVIGSALRTQSSPLAAVSVLVADRDPDTRSMYAEYLRDLGYHVEEAEDGRVALANALSHSPTLLVTETRLPGLSGFELCQLLRRDEATRRMHIIVVTAVAFPTDVQLAEAAGANAVLVKPCLPDRLEAEIRRIVAAPTASDRPAPEAPSRDAARDAQPGPRRVRLNRVHNRRETMMPTVAAPTLLCPSCDRPLTYRKSHLGGVSAKLPEQWDYFECRSGCGAFQYRHRSRRVRRLP